MLRRVREWGTKTRVNARATALLELFFDRAETGPGAWRVSLAIGEHELRLDVSERGESVLVRAHILDALPPALSRDVGLRSGLLGLGDLVKGARIIEDESKEPVLERDLAGVAPSAEAFREALETLALDCARLRGAAEGLKAALARPAGPAAAPVTPKERPAEATPPGGTRAPRGRLWEEVLGKTSLPPELRALSRARRGREPGEGTVAGAATETGPLAVVPGAPAPGLASPPAPAAAAPGATPAPAADAAPPAPAPVPVPGPGPFFPIEPERLQATERIVPDDWSPDSTPPPAAGRREKREKRDKVEKAEKLEKSGKLEKAGKLEKSGKIEKAEKVEKAEKAEKVEKVSGREKAEPREKAKPKERPEVPGRPARPRPDRERAESFEATDRIADVSALPPEPDIAAALRAIGIGADEPALGDGAPRGPRDMAGQELDEMLFGPDAGPSRGQPAEAPRTETPERTERIERRERPGRERTGRAEREPAERAERPAPRGGDDDGRRAGARAPGKRDPFAMDDWGPSAGSPPPRAPERGPPAPASLADSRPPEKAGGDWDVSDWGVLVDDDDGRADERAGAGAGPGAATASPLEADVADAEEPAAAKAGAGAGARGDADDGFDASTSDAALAWMDEDPAAAKRGRAPAGASAESALSWMDDVSPEGESSSRGPLAGSLVERSPSAPTRRPPPSPKTPGRVRIPERLLGSLKRLALDWYRRPDRDAYTSDVRKSEGGLSVSSGTEPGESTWRFVRPTFRLGRPPIEVEGYVYQPEPIELTVDEVETWLAAEGALKDDEPKRRKHVAEMRQQAFALVRDGRAEEAVATLEKVLGLAGEDVSALTSLGHIHRRRIQDLDRAMEWYDRALVVAPGFVPALLGRAAVLVERGDRHRAAEEASKALQQLPRDPDALELAGVVALRTGRRARAKELFQRLYRLERGRGERALALLGAEKQGETKWDPRAVAAERRDLAERAGDLDRFTRELYETRIASAEKYDQFLAAYGDLEAPERRRRLVELSASPSVTFLQDLLDRYLGEPAEEVRHAIESAFRGQPALAAMALSEALEGDDAHRSQAALTIASAIQANDLVPLALQAFRRQRVPESVEGFALDLARWPLPEVALSLIAKLERGFTSCLKALRELFSAPSSAKSDEAVQAVTGLLVEPGAVDLEPPVRRELEHVLHEQMR